MNTESATPAPASAARVTRVDPYLFFEGQCEEALGFYEQALGAQVVVKMRFAECPDPLDPGMGPVDTNKIMHAEFRIGEATFLASDGCAEGQQTYSGIGLALTAKNAPEVERIFNALAEGGSVQMPLGETFFAENFGMVADRFGVPWMIIAPKPMPGGA